MTPVPVRLGLAAAALVCASGPMAPEAAAAEMTREPTAIIQGLDKVAARVSRFEAPVGRAVHFGKLLVLVRDCERSAPEDRPENAAFAGNLRGAAGRGQGTAVRRLDVLVQPGALGSRAPGL